MNTQNKNTQNEQSTQTDTQQAQRDQIAQRLDSIGYQAQRVLIETELLNIELRNDTQTKK